MCDRDDENIMWGKCVKNNISEKEINKIDFLFVYEHPERELESIMLIGENLTKRGFKVEYYYRDSDILFPREYFGNVKVIAVPFLYSETDLYEVVYRIAGEVDSIVDLRWEQIYKKSVESDDNAFWYPKGEAKAAKHICWGMQTKENLIRVGVKEEDAVVLGCSTMDYLRPELSSYFLNKEELWGKYGLDVNSETVMFISSFSNVNVSKETINHMYQVMGKDKYDAFRENSIKSQKTILSWLLKLADKGYKIIYRPHPNEKISEEIKNINNDNFVVIGEYAVKQWLRNVDYVFTWISTTYAECNLAGIPCGILNPYKYDAEDEMSIFEDAKKIDSYDKMLDFIELVKINGMVETDEVIKRYFERDEIPAYIKTADYMEKLIKEQIFYPWNREIKDKFMARKEAEQRWIDKMLENHEKYATATNKGGALKALAGIYKKDYVFIEEKMEARRRQQDNAMEKEKEIIRKKIAHI